MIEVRATRGLEVLDLSERISLGAFSGISEEAEVTMTALAHSDLSLSVDDADGEVRGFLTGVEPSDLVYLEVVRTLDRRRDKWRRLFWGILDLPWSVSYDAKERVVELQAFSLSKLLERTSATTLARPTTGVALTAVITTPNQAATVNSTATLRVGDTVTLVQEKVGSTKTETKVIATIPSATQFTVTDTWANTFDIGTLVRLDTPYLRDVSVPTLISGVVALTGLPPFTVDVAQTTLVVPVQQDMNSQPIVLATAEPKTIVEFGKSSGGIDYSLLVKTSATLEYWAQNVRGGFTPIAATYSQGTGDWRPYATTRPGSLTAATVQPCDDNGEAAWDHANLRWYTIFDTGAGIDLRRNNVFLVNVNTFAGGYDSYLLDYDPVGDWVWVSYKRTSGVGSLARVRLSDNNVALVIPTGVPAFSQLRCVAALGAMAFYRPDDRTLTLYELGTTNAQVVYTFEASVYPYLWTLKVGASTIAVMYAIGGRTRLRVWDLSWRQVADYEVHDSAWPGYASVAAGGGAAARHPILSLTTDGTEDVFVGYAPSLASGAGRFFAASRAFVGVIKYADLKDMSCAEAVKEAAIACCALVRVDAEGYGLVAARGRTSIPTSALPEIADPIERDYLPISEIYRASVSVSGKTESGSELKRVAGIVGDSARRLDVEPKFATTDSLVATIAQMYASFLATPRREERLTIRDDGEPISVLDEVYFDGRRWIVLESSLDLQDEERELRLIEMGV